MNNNNRDRRFEQVALTTTIFSMLLTIFVATMTYFGKLMAEHNTIVILSLVAIVLIFQRAIFGIIRNHHHHHDHVSNNNNNNTMILYILVLSSVTSSIVVSLISYIAAYVTFILCCITFTWFASVKLYEISDAIRGVIFSIWTIILSFTYIFIFISLTNM
jgi:hypothetical protein